MLKFGTIDKPRIFLSQQYAIFLVSTILDFWISSDFHFYISIGFDNSQRDGEHAEKVLLEVLWNFSAHFQNYASLEVCCAINLWFDRVW